MRWTSFSALPRAHGEPLGQGRLRVVPEDFQVEEHLGFEPDGEGDHLLLWVRKTGANTEWVARKLAALAGVQGSAVGYAGLKDRHAVTAQWFSVPRPRQGLPDWSELNAFGIEVREVHAHRRKLRRGALQGNRFRIRVRDVGLDPERLRECAAAIAGSGVPNYFGAQRFGRDDANLIHAGELFSGAARRVPRHLRGLWLSAARSQIFNQVLAARVERGDWDRPLDGDCLQLDGSHSFFLAERIDETLEERSRRMDLHPTGPLWGRGDLPTQGAVRSAEEAAAMPFEGWTAGLAAAGMDQERRALRLPVSDLEVESDTRDLLVAFYLSAGSYATAVLREFVDCFEERAAEA
ncbi:tRNA pseudouridine 13 synthase [Imhoffiella purpurea]|uniref:tRNA pseudouridine synthase D n=1 Tax=Imhoffiella purpurea TaxID=1249627 RepID=W9V9Y8_9GAMM|nr:tRNA pseudouridine 13 synthase [Imhoffiella purpurea]